MNHEIKLPSRQKMYLPRKKGIHELGLRSHLNGRGKPLSVDIKWFLVGVGILVASIFIHLFLEPATATAKTLEAKDCMTNECVLRIVCGEETDYTNVAEICN